LQRGPDKGGQAPRDGEPEALTLDEAVRQKLNQMATVKFRVASAKMAWTTGFGNPDPWVIQLTPTAGLKDGGTFQLCVTAKAATHLRNLGLTNGYLEGKVIRLTGKVESWPDRDRRGVTVYRLCVFDLDHLEVVK
jgi:hypothetical protein